MRIRRREFLRRSGAALAGAALASPSFLRPAGAGALAAGGTSFFLLGDTHYCADDVEQSAMKASSADVNERLVGWLNRLPGTELPAPLGGGKLARPAGVIHAGDLVDNGDKGPAKFPMAETEMAAFVKDWGLNGGDGKLMWPVREVHGNHDSPRGDGPVISEIKARNKRRRGVTNISPNGLHYSWDWGGAHFVALGIVAGDAATVARTRRYAPLGSLPFLADDLAKHVGTSGRPVVIVHHVDVARYSTPVADDVVVKHEWDYGDVRAFHETLKPYRVAGTLYGHTHVRNLFLWDGMNNRKATTGIPSINTDNAAHYNDLRQAFLHLEIDAKELRVREFATTDAWLTGAWTPQQWRFPLPT
jgi:predicted phosphodiesterase